MIGNRLGQPLRPPIRETCGVFSFERAADHDSDPASAEAVFQSKDSARADDGNG